MFLDYSLQDNPLTPDPTDFRAQVQNQAKYTVAQIVEQMVEDGLIASTRKDECASLVDIFLRKLTQNVQQGIGFRSDYFSLYHTIAGVFTSKHDEFDADRHQVNLNLRTGKMMKQAMAQIKTRKLLNAVPTPEPVSFYDYRTDTTNEIITPGNTAELSGDLLKIEDDVAAEQGIFLMHSDGTTYSVPRIRVNQRKKLSFVLPDKMKKGTYTLEVRTTVSGSNEVRVGALEPTLQVQ